MEFNEFEKLINDYMKAEAANDDLFNLYKNSSSNTADVHQGFRRFVKNTELNRQRNQSYMSLSCIGIAFASLLAVLWMALTLKPVNENWISTTTDAGESKDLLLCDGSHLHIGPCSSVVYPETFNRNERKIFATGDIYFEVAGDEKRRFVVSSNGLDVIVHGTEFHLYSFPGLDNQEVELAQGSVSVSLRDEKSEIHLDPGEKLKYNKGLNFILKENFDSYSFYQQMSGAQILFDNDGLLEITRKLSNRFGNKIVVCDDTLLDQTYFASFINGEGLQEILAVLSKQGGFSVKKVGDDYLLMK